MSPTRETVCRKNIELCEIEHSMQYIVDVYVNGNYGSLTTNRRPESVTSANTSHTQL